MDTIFDKGLSIKLGVRRGGDSYESATFMFSYVGCNRGSQECVFCQVNVDGINEVGTATIRLEAPKPIPGNKKQQIVYLPKVPKAPRQEPAY